MKTLILFVLVCSIIVFFENCNKISVDEKLSLQKTIYSGNELKLNGYFYEIHDNLTTIYFLYKDGTILYAYSHQNKTLNEIEKEMVDNNMYNDNKNKKGDKTRWGLFLINEKDIQFERWDASSGGGLPIINCSGYIENDTTFHISRIFSSENQKEYFGAWIYHFKQFSNKPDSTNSYIK